MPVVRRVGISVLRRILFAVAAAGGLVALLGSAGCLGGSDCTTEADCFADEVCRNNVCIPASSVSEEDAGSSDARGSTKETDGGDEGSPRSDGDSGVDESDGTSTGRDRDGDGLSDAEERNEYGTNPAKADTDGDGLDDGEEVEEYGTDPTSADTDGDGLTDGEEVNETETDPLQSDSDGDGLSDAEEVREIGSDPNKSDTDGDGLADGEEVQKYETDPTAEDTDGDGLSDAEEVNEYGTDPTSIHSDGDGLTDGEETREYDTDPTRTDSDGDGLDDGEEIEFGSDPTRSDTDSDGLSDLQEKRAGSDPTKSDTDGDGLSDREEVEDIGSDPAAADTDGDGLADAEEQQFGLDPTRSDTFGNGTEDGERAFVEACQQKETKTRNSISSSGAYSFTFTLGDNFESTEVTVPSGRLDVFSQSSGPVRGFVYAYGSSSSKSAVEKFEGVVSDLQSARSPSLFGSNWKVASYQTHDGYQAVTRTWNLETVYELQPDVARNRLVYATAPFSASDVSDLPDPSGERSRNWNFHLTLVDRGDRVLLLGALAAESAVSQNPGLNGVLRSSVDSGALEAAGASRSAHCQSLSASEGSTKLDFYWMLDQSGQAADRTKPLVQTIEPSLDLLDQYQVDHRHGVTNMDPNNDGRLFAPPTWTGGTEELLGAIRDGVMNCGGASGTNWACSGADEYGLEAGRSGLKHMLGLSSETPTSEEEIRADSEVVVYFFTDEEANAIKSDGKDVQQFRDFYSQHATVFAMVGDGDDCGMDEGRAYKEVALASGGAHATACPENWQSLMDEMMRRAAARAGGYEFDRRPILSTVTVYVDGVEITQSDTDGWQYVQSGKSLLLSGNAAPGDGASDSHVFVTYDSY